jgi:hypothetical protein
MGIELVTDAAARVDAAPTTIGRQSCSLKLRCEGTYGELKRGHRQHSYQRGAA